MARRGLFKRVQPAGAVDANLISRLQDNIGDAVETLAKDHDVLSAPAVYMQKTGTIPPGAAVVVFNGASGASLTLPPANSQGANVGTLLCIVNQSTVGILFAIPSRGDTINGATSVILPTTGDTTLSVAAKTMLLLCSDGVSTWQTAGFSGRLLRTPQFLSSGTTITHPTGTAVIKVRAIGGGGGGGGVAAAAAAQSTLASGGGGGSYAERAYIASALTSTYVIGAAGTAGASGGGTGGTGGSTTFTHGGGTVTAGGGTGGAFAASAATAAFLLGGAGGTPSGGNFNAGGVMGGYGVRPDAASPTVALSGAGGNGPYAGGGGAPATGTSAGNSGTGFGGGGGGALSVNGGAAQAGAVGNQGLIIVEEYS